MISSNTYNKDNNNKLKQNWKKYKEHTGSAISIFKTIATNRYKSHNVAHNYYSNLIIDKKERDDQQQSPADTLLENKYIVDNIVEPGIAIDEYDARILADYIKENETFEEEFYSVEKLIKEKQQFLWKLFL